MQPRISVLPEVQDLRLRGDAEAFLRRREKLFAAVRAAGGMPTSLPEANGLVWLTTENPERLAEIGRKFTGIRWVQLPWAGVDGFELSNLFIRPLIITCAKGAFGSQVSEHALMLILACLRNLGRHARTGSWSVSEPTSLQGKRVTLIGAGGISAGLTRFLAAADCDVTVLRRKDEEFPQARRTASIAQLHEVLPGTEILVLALALTTATRHLIGGKELALLPPRAVLVNVARGAHVDTEALVGPLRSGHLVAAGLDVTDPEPLPTGHVLWSMPNVLITSHSADSPDYVTEKLAERVYENVRRLASNRQLLGVVDPVAGY